MVGSLVYKDKGLPERKGIQKMLCFKAEKVRNRMYLSSRYKEISHLVNRMVVIDFLSLK